MASKAVVFGGAGFLGSHVVEDVLDVTAVEGLRFMARQPAPGDTGSNLNAILVIGFVLGMFKLTVQTLVQTGGDARRR